MRTEKEWAVSRYYPLVQRHAGDSRVHRQRRWRIPRYKARGAHAETRLSSALRISGAGPGPASVLCTSGPSLGPARVHHVGEGRHIRRAGAGAAASGHFSSFRPLRPQRSPEWRPRPGACRAAASSAGCSASPCTLAVRARGSAGTAGGRVDAGLRG